MRGDASRRTRTALWLGCHGGMERGRFGASMAGGFGGRLRHGLMACFDPLGSSRTAVAEIQIEVGLKALDCRRKNAPQGKPEKPCEASRVCVALPNAA